MLLARRTLLAEFQKCHKLLMDIARSDEVCRRFMTVPGVGPVTALSFKCCIDDPARFRRSKTVGAHLGLTPKRYQSGSVDFNSRVSKCGDANMRWLLVEAANSMLTHVRSWSVLKAWGKAFRSGLDTSVRLSRWPGKSPSSCTVCGLMAASLLVHAKACRPALPD